MNAREAMAVLFERRIIGEEPGTLRHGRAVAQAGDELDQHPRLATHPETAVECIVRTCRRCHCQWAEAPLDAVVGVLP